MKKFLLLTSSLLFTTCLFSQSYRITIETLVANKIEDKFSFSMSVGDSQTKGFDGRLLAKRYRAHGFPHKVLAAEEAFKKQEKAFEEELALKPDERIKKLLLEARKNFDSIDNRMSVLDANKQTTEENIKELESLESLLSRGASSFTADYNAYLKKKELTPEDFKLKKLMNRRPRDTGDVEEIELGSFCKISILKAVEKKIYVNFDYAFSRIHSYFYSDGNNNDNTITKHPIVERFEKMNLKNMLLIVGKPYCFQFTRVSPEKARSLSDALASTGIFGSGDADKAKAEEKTADPELTALDAQGAYNSIKRKYQTEAGKVTRVVITVKEEK